MDMDMNMNMNMNANGQAQADNNITNNIPNLLAMARQHIKQGNPSLALEAVITAMRDCGGEHAAMWTLHRAQEMYNNRMQEDAVAKELASLFAECAITDASSNVSAGPSPFNNSDGSGSAVLADTSKASILAESGRMQIVKDAFADGSSFVCMKCGGLVSNSRRDEHLVYWCGTS